MCSFSVDWLNLREAADYAARDKNLAQTLLTWLGQAADPISPDRILVDLGAGTGATLRALTKQGANNIVWRLVELDGKLLDEALHRHGKQYLIEDYQSDLNVIAELPLTGANVITASALLDLTSKNFIDSLIARIDTRKTAFYAALNYDGHTSWSPAHPLDEKILAAFNQDQLRDKGFGPALGPNCTEYLQQVLNAKNYSVTLAASPWYLSGQDQALVIELIEGIAAALNENTTVTTTELNEWKQFRLAQSANGTCTIGHWDLLALPG